MSRSLYAIGFVLLAAVLSASAATFYAGLGPDAAAAVNKEDEVSAEGADCDVLFQVSTIDALLLSVYDGILPVGDLKEHGDFGIGTFDRLEGEMVVLDGECYQVKVDGVAYLVGDDVTTPFATVTHFSPDETVFIDWAENYTQFGEELGACFPSMNMFYAVKIEGNFPYMKTRSVPGQEKPYPKLVDVVEDQTVFEFQNVSGTVVGFWSPEFVKGVNVPGYHLHFLTDDKKAGGHILDFQLDDSEVEVDLTSDFFMILPTEGDFYSVDLTQDLHSELEKVEK
ncbi:MAG: acetolactate decarboxylase [Methanotrichaceae archaeon]